MDIKQIGIFLKLADTLNFARTAQELYTTQPTITREIKAMEEEIQVQLFKRDKHSVVLTPAGAVLRSELSTVYSSMENAIAKAQNYQNEFEHQLNIGFCHEESIMKLWEAMRIFRSLYPRVRINLRAASLATLQNEFERENLDIVFGMRGYLHPSKKNEHIENLYKGYWIIAVSPLHPLGNRDRISMEDLDGHTVVVWDQAEHPVYIEQFYKTLQNMCPNTKYTYVSGRQEDKMLVKAGFGISALPFYSLREEEGMRLIPLDYNPPYVRDGNFDYAILSRNIKQDKYVAEFIRIIKELYNT